MVDAILAGLRPGPERFAALALRVGIDFGSAEEVLAQAQDEADADELVRGRVLDLLGYMTYMYRGDLNRAASSRPRPWPSPGGTATPSWRC